MKVQDVKHPDVSGAMKKMAHSHTSIQAALESIKKLDLGDLEPTYRPNDHTDLDCVDLSIIDPEAGSSDDP